MKVTCLILFILISLPNLLVSQINQNDQCGITDHEFSFFNKRVDHEELHEIIRRFDATKDQVLYRVPVKFWIYRRSDGNGGIDLKAIKKNIMNLNYYHSINNTGFRFYLRPDFEYIDKDRLYKLNYNTQAPVQLFLRHSKGCINVLVPEKLKKNRINAVDNNYNGTYNQITKGVILARGASSSSLTHEIGHYFGLNHPHKYWNFKPKQEPVSRDRTIRNSDIRMCEKKGDRLCDTPAEPYLSIYTDDKCRYTGWNVTDKYGDVYKPDVDNIMSYTKNRECRKKFTEEQIALMLYTVSKNKYHNIWSTKSENAEDFIFDYYEPDDHKEIASQIFFNTPQNHTFHMVCTSNKVSKLSDNIDWLYFISDNQIAQNVELVIKESDIKFSPVKISIYNESGLISESKIEKINGEKRIKILTNAKGTYFIRVQKIMSQKHISGYKLLLAK